MKITTLNINGIRAAARKGFYDWLERERPDVLCLQEIKAKEEQLNETFYPDGYYTFFFPAEKPGYSGVAVYSRREPDDAIKGLGWEDMDAEGRYLEVRFGTLSVVSLYLPSGTSGDVRQAVKYSFMDRFKGYLRDIRDTGRNYIICGDWNIAHRKIDLKNWRGNQKNSGFLPEERAWMDELFNETGYLDAYRLVEPETEQYTWWSNRGQAWTKNVGWRIDYHVISPGLRDCPVSASVHMADRFSDHAPLTIEYRDPESER